MNKSSTTRSALLTKARRLFAQHGYRGTSVREITRMARANLGAVTYHFGSKANLYNEVLSLAGESLLAALRTANTSDCVPLERVKALIRAYFNYMTTDPYLPSIVLHEISLHRPVPEPIGKTLAAFFDFLEAAIREGQSQGSIVESDPRLTAVTIVAQPAYLMLMRRPLQSFAGIHLDRVESREAVLAHLMATIDRSLSVERDS